MTEPGGRPHHGVPAGRTLQLRASRAAEVVVDAQDRASRARKRVTSIGIEECSRNVDDAVDADRQLTGACVQDRGGRSRREPWIFVSTSGRPRA